MLKVHENSAWRCCAAFRHNPIFHSVSSSHCQCSWQSALGAAVTSVQWGAFTRHASWKWLPSLCLTVREKACPAASPRNVSAKRRLTRRNRPLHVAACRPEWVNLKWPVLVATWSLTQWDSITMNLLYTWYHFKKCAEWPNLSRPICFFTQGEVWQDLHKILKISTRNKTNYKLGSTATLRVQAAETLLRKHGHLWSFALHALNSHNTNMQHHHPYWPYDTTQQIRKRLTVRALDLDDHDNNIKEKLALS